MSSGSFNGVALGIAAAGGVLVWSGVQNQTIITTLKYLLKGEQPPAGPQESHPYQGTGNETYSASGSLVVQAAKRYLKRCYRFGGAHNGNCSGCMDCSGYVSCVMVDIGAMHKGKSLTTDGFLSWSGAFDVPFAQRQPGDLLIWQGGPGGGHMGIAVSGSKMINNPCTGCGGVQYSSYGRTRTGRITHVRRVGSSPSSRKYANLHGSG